MRRSDRITKSKTSSHSTKLRPTRKRHQQPSPEREPSSSPIPFVRSKRRTHPKPIPELPSSPISDSSYPETTDPTKVTRPVEELVHEMMSRAWKVNNDRPMCFIFDVVNPARQFKRGMLYDEDAEFPDYGPEPWDDLTEADTDEPGWMPYKPIAYQQVFPVYLPCLCSCRTLYFVGGNHTLNARSTFRRL